MTLEDMTKLLNNNNDSDIDSCDMMSCDGLHATVSIDSEIEESTDNTPLENFIVLQSPEQTEVEVLLPALPPMNSVLHLQSTITAHTPAFGSASTIMPLRVHQVVGNYS